ncbi:MAG: CBS domain-containing protein [Aquificaceae bacterium]|nr:CBS domain-containing protein [Aquificaceae bacterium]
MKDLELANLTSGVPGIDYNLSVREALRAFEEYALYDFLVVIKDGKPIGIVNKLDLIKAQHKSNLTVGDLARPIMKLRASTVSREELIYLLDFFNNSRLPMFLVDKKGAYLGVLFYHVVLYHVSLFKETSIPLFQKLRSMLGQAYYFYCFYVGGVEELPSTLRKSLQRLIQEGVKARLPGDVSLSQEEEEVYALSSLRLKEDEIKGLYEEFHKEYTLLFAEEKPAYLYGYCFSLEGLKSFDEFFRLGSELKKRMENVQDASFFIFHGEKPSVVMCEYERREYINQIKLKISQDFESIVEGLKRTDRDLWEVALYDYYKKYPYFELFYIIGESGLQISNNIVNPKLTYPVKIGKKGADRSEKEYFKRANLENVFISHIYISQATDDFCITVSKKFNYGNKSYVLAGDINYKEIHRLVKYYADAGKTNRQFSV